MTTTTTTTAKNDSGRTLAVGVAAALVPSAFDVFGADSWQEIAIIVGLVVLTTLLVFGLVLPRALRKESAGGTSLALSIPAALLVVPAFWAGIPFVLGLGGMVVGAAGRQAHTGSGKAIAGLVIGALAALAYLVIFLTDLAHNGPGFLFS